MGLSDNLFKPRDTRFHALASTETAPERICPAAIAAHKKKFGTAEAEAVAFVD